jgi:hypothetical protein
MYVGMLGGGTSMAATEETSMNRKINVRNRGNEIRLDTIDIPQYVFDEQLYADYKGLD